MDTFEQIRKRAKAHKNKTQLALRVGCSRGHLYEIIRGEQKPGGLLMVALMKELNIPRMPGEEEDYHATIIKRIEELRETLASYNPQHRHQIALTSHLSPPDVESFASGKMKFPPAPFIFALTVAAGGKIDTQYVRDDEGHLQEIIMIEPEGHSPPVLKKPQKMSIPKLHPEIFGAPVAMDSSPEPLDPDQQKAIDQILEFDYVGAIQTLAALLRKKG